MQESRDSRALHCHCPLNDRYHLMSQNSCKMTTNLHHITQGVHECLRVPLSIDNLYLPPPKRSCPVTSLSTIYNEDDTFPGTEAKSQGETVGVRDLK